MTYSHYRRTRIPGPVDVLATRSNPASISSLVRWYAADEITGLNDGDYVETWPDLSGWYDGTSSGAGRPTYKTNIINGLPVVRFNGAHYVAHGYLILSNATYFIVWSRTGAANNDAVLLSTSTQYAYLQYSSSWYTANGVATSIPMSADTFMLKCNIYTGTQHLPYTNGIAESVRTTTAEMISSYIGGGGFSLGGDVAELIIYSRDLSGGERELVENYLNRRYSLW